MCTICLILVSLLPVSQLSRRHLAISSLELVNTNVYTFFPQNIELRPMASYLFLHFGFSTALVLLLHIVNMNIHVYFIKISYMIEDLWRFPYFECLTLALPWILKNNIKSSLLARSFRYQLFIKIFPPVQALRPFSPTATFCCLLPCVTKILLGEWQAL